MTTNNIAWLRVKTTTERFRLWQQIAKQSGISLSQWINNVLASQTNIEPEENQCHQILPPWPAQPSFIEKNKVRLRFWSRVCIKPDQDECWIWSGYTRKDGFGEFKPRPRYNKLAHKLAYEDKYGVINNNLTHTCKQSNCCNPAHMVIM